MKKVVFLIHALYMLMMVVACTNIETSVEIPQETKINSRLRTVDQAIEIASQFKAINSRAGEKIGVANVEIIGASEARANSDTLIYAINFDDNQGFTLVSAARSGVTVLGYTTEGYFDHSKANENPSFSYYLDAAKSYAANELGGSGFISDDSISMGGLIRDPIPIIPSRKVIVDPRVEVNYGQHYPEGMYCPNKISGCVMTAMAMAFSYLERPSSISYTCNEFDITYEIINWRLLKEHIQSIKPDNEQDIINHLNDCEGPEQYHKLLGRLCRELGYRNDAQYSWTSTGSNAFDARITCMQLLGDNKVSTVKSFAKPFLSIENELEAKECVAIIFGNETPNSGHAWVCDGVEDYIYEEKVLRYDGTYDIIEKHNPYYSYNWGACGHYNGYFYAGVFDPSKARSRYNFDQDVHYIVLYK